MTQGKDHSGTPHASTDDLLNDYLSDMFGSESPCAADEELVVSDPLLIENVSEVAELSHVESQDAVLLSKSNAESASHGLSVDGSGMDSLSTKTLVLDEPEQHECSVRNILNEARPSISKPIPLGYSLVPTINLTHCANGGFRTQSEAQIILLSLLFYLRRPLSPRVRLCFLNFAEQAIDDYHAAFWLSARASQSSL